MQTLDITKIYSVKEQQEQYTRILKESEYADIFSEIEASIEYDDFQFAYLSQLYTIEEPNPVRLFINEHLYKVLFEAPDHIKHIFGDVPLNLELHHDPEEGWDELFIIIKTSLNAEKAIELEKKLFDEWFVHIMPSTKNKLNIIEEPA